MSSVGENIRKITLGLPGGVRLVAVSKTQPVDAIMEAYQYGQRLFGENRVQELISKQPVLPGDIEWHLIGHLQTNKVKFIVPFVSMIQSVDSIKLLTTISREAVILNRTIDVLLQIHIAEEDTKFGFSSEELLEMLENNPAGTWPGVCIRGLMGMATFTDDMEQVRREFSLLALLFRAVKDRFFTGMEYFNELSMGMSGDYQVAVGEGSTIVRIGSGIFGRR